MNTSLRRRMRRAAVALPAALVVAGLGASAASAAPATVTGGQLTWSMVNAYDATQPLPPPAKPLNRTALGFFARTNALRGELGTVSASGAAWGDVVTPTTPKSATTSYSWTFPVVGGTYDAAAGTGIVKLLGTVHWDGVGQIAPSPYTFVPFGVTVEDPTVVLDGTSTAKLYASGTGANGSAVEAPYTRDAPLFTLDLADATVTPGADGSQTLGPLVPTYSRTDVFFSMTSTGPDREPNTWGSFALNVVTPQTGPKGDAGANGTNGTNGANGKDGANGTAGKNGVAGKSATRVIAYLRKAPFSGSKARKVSLLRQGKVVATGTVKKKTLNVTVKQGKSVSRGTYTLKAGKAKRSVKIG